MLNIKGKNNDAIIYTDNVDKQTIGQVIELCNQEFTRDSRIRIMPDAHCGIGCTIGTTMTIRDKVVPNLVGVDIGCVSGDTEYLTKDGWKPISQYSGEEVLIYDKESNSSRFEKPIAFIKEECQEFYHIKTKYGVDQKVSKDHKMLFVKGSHHRPASRGKMFDILAEDMFNTHNSLKLGFRDKMIANIPSIQLNSSGIDLTDDEIRVQVMVCADGHLGSLTNWCRCSFKKVRKIERAEQLLKDAKITFKKETKNGITNFTFHAPIGTKRIGKCFKDANIEQLKIVLEELRYWDSEVKTHIFCSKYKSDADFVQFLWSINGYRATISFDNRDGKESYRVIPTANPLVGFAGTPKTPINIVPSDDGFKYCFTTSTGYWIMRHNGCICVTGNCGMAVYKLKIKELDLDKLDSLLGTRVPSGFAIRQNEFKEFTKHLNLKELKCYEHINEDRALKSLGSMGGGNHFCEVARDDDGALYLILHSGSRHLGKQVCEYYQEEAVKYQKERKAFTTQRIIENCKAMQCEDKIPTLIAENVERVPEALSYLTGQLFEDYLHDMRIVQRYAELNREAMAIEILSGMGLDPQEVVESYFHTVHNYIDLQNMILRKGAVSARKGETLLIPINMSDGSLLCVGKGNPEWNYSAPHGAGRVLSRAQARKELSMDEFKESMSDVYTTSVMQSTLDEAPKAYKPIEDIVDNIGDTVEIISILKPIYNYKAH